jgi:hypothetical protein
MNKTLFAAVAVETMVPAVKTTRFRPTPVPNLTEPVELIDSELDAVTGGASAGFFRSEVASSKVDVVPSLGLKAPPLT